MIKEKINRKKAGIHMWLVIALVLGMTFSYIGYFQNLKIVPTEDGKSWHVLYEGNLVHAAEASPSAGESLILEIFFVNHTAAPATAFQRNTSSEFETWANANLKPSGGAGNAYANGDDFNLELRHSVAFDVIVRVRGNRTCCYRSDVSKFYDSDLKVEWTSADLSVGADTAMSRLVSYNSSGANFLYINFYSQGGGSGFTLPKDASYDITSIKFSAYY